jgi:hypothetical protein
MLFAFIFLFFSGLAAAMQHGSISWGPAGLDFCLVFFTPSTTVSLWFTGSNMYTPYKAMALFGTAAAC